RERHLRAGGTGALVHDKEPGVALPEAASPADEVAEREVEETEDGGEDGRGAQDGEVRAGLGEDVDVLAEHLVEEVRPVERLRDLGLLGLGGGAGPHQRADALADALETEVVGDLADAVVELLADDREDAAQGLL